MKHCLGPSPRRLLSIALALAGLVLSNCGPDGLEPVGPPAGPSLALTQPPNLTKALDVQGRYTDRLLRLQGVVGTAVGLGSNGQAVVLLYTKVPDVQGLPASLEGVPVSAVVTGEIRAVPTVTDAPAELSSGVHVDPTASFSRPVPIGVSTGSQGECSVGTIGARVKSGNATYALSNNHLYALENTAPLGSKVLQPGRADLNCASGSTAVLGPLSKFVPIQFSTSAKNRVDAAIAAATTANLSRSTPSDGYGTPSATIASATLNQVVQKYGRTTGLTTGTVVGLNGIFDVYYASGAARFVGQITIKSRGQFSRPGDSGALIVDADRRPIGLLFAGTNSGYTFANQIGDVLKALQVSIDGN
jgi:hypothetical protein